MKRSDPIERIQQLLDRDGPAAALPSDLREAVDRDPELRRLWEDLRALERALRDADPAPVAPPRQLHDRIMSRVRAAAEPSRRFWTSHTLVPLAAAATILIVFGFYMIFRPADVDPTTRSATEIMSVQLPSLSFSAELQRPKQFMELKSRIAMDSARNFFIHAGRIVPDLPATSPSPRDGEDDPAAVPRRNDARMSGEIYG